MTSECKRSSSSCDTSTNTPLSPSKSVVNAVIVTDDDASPSVERLQKKVSYDRIRFRQHETTLCVPQGGVSTVPAPSLGLVTEYTDDESVDVDEYERVRTPERKKLEGKNAKTKFEVASSRKKTLETMRIEAAIALERAGDAAKGSIGIIHEEAETVKEKKKASGPRGPPSPSKVKFKTIMKRCSSIIESGVESGRRFSRNISILSVGSNRSSGSNSSS